MLFRIKSSGNALTAVGGKMWVKSVKVVGHPHEVQTYIVKTLSKKDNFT